MDSIAGGGGLIVIPALLFAGVPPLYALGTNKLQSVFGTAVALRNYSRSGLVEWRPNRLTVVLVFIGAVAGALVVHGRPLPVERSQRRRPVLVRWWIVGA